MEKANISCNLLLDEKLNNFSFAIGSEFFSCAHYTTRA